MKRVLIVDDEQSFLLSLRDGLAEDRKDFKVLTAENGREAVAILRTVAVDLLVTDLKLPVMDGFELLAWVSRNQPKLPVIVMSAFGTPETEARLSEMHAVKYLEKPLDLGVLRESILTGLNKGAKSYIRGITLATFLQLMAAEKKSCTLKVTVGEEVGFLYVDQGDLIDANTAYSQGQEAAMEIVAWDNAEIEMDNVCQRQQRVIHLSMEHVLIEAFRLKDEKNQSLIGETNSPQTKAKPQPTASAQQAAPPAGQNASHGLRVILKTLSSVQEYAIFDSKGFLLDKNAGTCSISGIEPNKFTPQIDQVASLLNFGSFNSLSFLTGDRCRYLLFCWKQYQVFIKLIPGSKPKEVLSEIRNHVNRASNQGNVKG